MITDADKKAVAQQLRQMLASRGEMALHHVARELKISGSDAASVVVEMAGEDIRRARFDLAALWTSRES